jgi:hypothetical protein
MNLSALKMGAGYSFLKLLYFYLTARRHVPEYSIHYVFTLCVSCDVLSFSVVHLFIVNNLCFTCVLVPFTSDL